MILAAERLGGSLAAVALARFSGSSYFEDLRQQSLGDSRDLAVAAI